MKITPRGWITLAVVYVTLVVIFFCLVPVYWTRA